MDYNINYLVWKILCWNIRGLNSEDKQLALHAKIVESGCAIACIQETKKESFDRKFIKGCCPKQFDTFAYSPSVGASGGILVVWKSSIFSGLLIETKRFGIIISFSSAHTNQKWTLVVVYGPCEGEERDNFVRWLYNLAIPDDEMWLFLGDFNFIRSEQNRSRPGADVNDMFLFNELIDHLGLLELPLKGRSFTWSNMQQNPLMEQLDWFFTTHNWITCYPNTVVTAMAKPTSDHVPCLVSIDTVMPKAKLFRFENFWVNQPGFLDCVTSVWSKPTRASSSSGVLAEKFKTLRSELNKWKMSLSKIKLMISKCNIVILFMDELEEERRLFVQEVNFRKIVKLHLEKLLRIQYQYWKKRCTIRWIKMGEENTNFFHAMAT
jgi:exonuclease III